MIRDGFLDPSIRADLIAGAGWEGRGGSDGLSGIRHGFTNTAKYIPSCADWRYWGCACKADADRDNHPVRGSESFAFVKVGCREIEGCMPSPRTTSSSTVPLVGLYGQPRADRADPAESGIGTKAHHDADQYIDRKAVAEEVAYSRRTLKSWSQRRAISAPTRSRHRQPSTAVPVASAATAPSCRRGRLGRSNETGNSDGT
jgi:hypothetical protein